MPPSSPAAPVPALSVRDAAKAFGGIQALCGVDLDVAPGERVALLGPNGAGKTTLMRCLSGRVRPERGTFRLLGKPLSRRARAEKLGLVPQDIALYPALTARANLETFGRMYGLRGDLLNDRVDWALAWVGLERRAHDRIAAYSGGMKRRINLACGVLHRPKIVLLDEPTAGVDPQSRERIYAMLEELRAEGAALVLATHHLEEAEDRSDRIVILDHGRVIADGTVQELIESGGPARPVVVLSFDRAPCPMPGLEPGPGPLEATAHLEDLTRDLPPLLSRLAASGLSVGDLRTSTPSLQKVFLDLTGRELRE